MGEVPLYFSRTHSLAEKLLLLEKWQHTDLSNSGCGNGYRGTTLIRNSLPIGPYGRHMIRAIERP